MRQNGYGWIGGWWLSIEVASVMEGNVGSHSEANNVELSVTPNSCNREFRESMLAHASLPSNLL